MQQVLNEDFSALADFLEERAAADAEYSAQLAVYYRGELVLSRSVGEHLSGDALTCVFSCTKGLGALVVALLVQDGVIDPAAPMASYWPEFAAAGKGKLTVAEVLSHQSGLVGVPGGLPVDVLLDAPRAAEVLAKLPSIWPLGQNIHGYHALTLGILLDELVRRVTGRSTAEIFEQRIRRPLGVDAYIGLPEELEPRYRDVLEPVDAPPAFCDPFSPAGLALNSSRGMEGRALHEVPNDRRVREVGPTSLGGVANAQALAAVYAASFMPVPQLGVNAPYLEADVWAAVSREQVCGIDRIGGLIGAFALGFMKPTPRKDFGSIFAYGHDGANSSLAFADPVHQLAFGYVPSRHEGQKAVSTGVELSALARQIILRKGK